MKKLSIIATILFTAMLTVPAWAHHAAEGIISDELWSMIDDMLVDADTPHLDLVLDDMGQPVLITTFEVEDDEVDDVLSAIGETLVDLSRGASSISIDIQPVDDGVTEISIVESVGSGMSQTLPDTE